MVKLVNFFASSIHRKILSGFGVVFIPFLIVAINGYYQLGQVRSLSEQILPYSLQMSHLQELALSISSLDANIERFFLIGGSQLQENIYQDLENMATALEAVKSNADQEQRPTLAELEKVTAQLATEIATLVDRSGLSSKQTNKKIILIYSYIGRAQTLHQALTQQTVNQLHMTAVAQKNIIAGVITQFLVSGSLVLLSIVVASLLVTRSIALPLSRLADTAARIAAGDLTVQGPVVSRDEVGQLGQAFNRMTARLRALVTSLEQRIAERKQVEAVLRESQHRLRTIFNSVQAGIIIIDAETRQIVDVNPATLRLFGAGREEVVGAICHQFICPAEQDRCPVCDLGQEVDNSERILLTARGETVPILKNVVVATLDGRRHLVESFVSIDERKQAEEALRQSETRYRRLFEQTQAALAETQALYQAVTAVTSSLREEEVIEEILEQLSRVVSYDTASVQLLRQGYLEIVGGRGWPHPSMVVGVRFPVPADNPNTVVIRQRQPLVLGNVSRRFPIFRKLQHSKHILSWLGVPLIIHDSVIGMMALDSTESDYFTPDHIRLVTAFAGQVAIALENVRLLQSERDQLHLARTLQAVGALLTTQLSLEEVLGHIFDLLAQVLPYDSVSVQLMNEAGSVELVAGRGFPDFERARQVARSVADQTLAKRFSQNQVVVIPDTTTEPDWIVAEGQEYIRSWIGAALLVERRLVGVLNVDSATANAYNEATGQTVAAFANQAAVAIVNTRMVTDLRRTEEALRQSEERYRRLVQNSPDGIIIHQRNRIVFINPAGARLFGETEPDEMLGKPVIDFIHPAFRTAVQNRMRQLNRTTNKVALVEEQFLLLDGTEIEVEMTVIPFIYQEQSARQLIFRDIMERKRAEAEREGLIKELETKNAELERFTYTVSHDLKSPLVTIRGFLGYLEEDIAAGNSEQVKTDIARISNAADRMNHLLDELLELSRIGRLINPPEMVPMGDLAREAVEMVSGRLARRGVEVEIASDLPPVYGDRARLAEILQNLVDNAVKFMGKQPKPQIEIGMRRDDERVFYIRDNGVGIDPAYHDRVFELFDKLDQKTEGSGIGLAIVKRIIEMHGGRIWVESAGTGQGSTFYFTLPLEKVSTAQKG